MKKETLHELQKEMKKHLGDKWDLRITAEKHWTVYRMQYPVDTGMKDV